MSGTGGVSPSGAASSSGGDDLGAVGGGGTSPASGSSSGGSSSGAGASGAGASAGGAAGSTSGGARAGASGSMSQSGAGASASGGGGTNPGTSAACEMVATEYAAELDRQLACNPRLGSQCTDRAAAVAGCECRVFIEPSDPFAIDHLANLESGWFDQDCAMPACPSSCSTANVGICQADASSPLGGRCVTP